MVNGRPTQLVTNMPPYSNSFDDDDGFDLGDNDENNNLRRYTSGHYSRRQPVHTFPTSL